MVTSDCGTRDRPPGGTETRAADHQVTDDPATRQHLITMLDQSLWLLQWAANATTLTVEERQKVEQRLATLEQALRAVLARHKPL